MKITCAFQYELYVDETRRAALSRNAGCRRFVFNKALGIQNERKSKGEKLLTYKELAHELVLWKKQPETAFLREAMRFVFNKALGIQNERKSKGEKLLTYKELAHELVLWKKQPETAFLREAMAQPLQQAKVKSFSPTRSSPTSWCSGKNNPRPPSFERPWPNRSSKPCSISIAPSATASVPRAIRHTKYGRSSRRKISETAFGFRSLLQNTSTMPTGESSSRRSAGFDTVERVPSRLSVQTGRSFPVS